MTQQLSLYEAQVLGVPHNGTDTSVAAAVAVAPHRSAQEQLVLDYLRAHGPAIQHAIADGLGLPLQSINARINALAKAGAVYDTGVRQKTLYGRDAAVWTVAS